jgi:endonuclease III
MAAADPTRLARIIRSLGFQNRRARALIRFSAEYDEWDRSGRPGDAEGLRDLYAVGDYAVDSWAIFVDGRRDVTPTDLKLIWWLAERA